MRRYDLVSRIFLILSIIDVALAAPVLVQEKCQAYLGVVYNPEPSVVDNVRHARWIPVGTCAAEPRVVDRAQLRVDAGAWDTVDPSAGKLV